MALMQLTSFDSCHESTGGQVLNNDQNQKLRTGNWDLLTSVYKGGRPAAIVGSMLSDPADNKSMSCVDSGMPSRYCRTTKRDC